MTVLCPVCAADHPTGLYTQTFHDVTHNSRECGHVARRTGLGPRELNDRRGRAWLAAAKRDLEATGLDACHRCGTPRDGRDCPRCGAWRR